MNQKKPKDSEHRPRRPYRKPRIRVVPLRPEEAVLGFCKTDSSAGPGQPTCTTIPGGCAQPGT